MFGFFSKENFFYFRLSKFKNKKYMKFTVHLQDIVSDNNVPANQKVIKIKIVHKTYYPIKILTIFNKLFPRIYVRAHTGYIIAN